MSIYCLYFQIISINCLYFFLRKILKMSLLDYNLYLLSSLWDRMASSSIFIIISSFFPSTESTTFFGAFCTPLDFFLFLLLILLYKERTLELTDPNLLSLYNSMRSRNKKKLRGVQKAPKKVVDSINNSLNINLLSLISNNVNLLSLLSNNIN